VWQCISVQICMFSHDYFHESIRNVKALLIQLIGLVVLHPWLPHELDALSFSLPSL